MTVPVQYVCMGERDLENGMHQDGGVGEEKR
jgi:hypothetical protein